MADCSEELLALCTEKLRDLRKRLTGALTQLGDEDINWRPNEESNSIANLVMHMAGNLHQRLESGIGGLFDKRNRDGEFNYRGAMTAAEALAIVDGSFGMAERVLGGLTSADLGRKQTIRETGTTILDVVFRVVTHLPEHVGQVIYIAKLRRGGHWQALWSPHRRK